MSASDNMVVSTTKFKDPTLQLLFLWVTALSLVLNWMRKFQDLENQRRVLILVYQIMRIHIDRQPAVDKHGNRLSASTLFFRLSDSDPDCQREEVMFEDIPQTKEGIAASLLTSCATSIIIQQIPVM